MKKVIINKREYEIIREPHPHILVSSDKELHGWYEGVSPFGRRECTSERLLINPYNGCSNNCFYCYAKSYPGYLTLFKDTNIITVFKDFDKVVAKQLDKINIASCGYLSPVTDPFQKINEYYKLSEKIIKEFINRNIPIEFITKSNIPDEVIELIREQKHSFGQISILTLDERLRTTLMDEGAKTDELLHNITKLRNNNIFCVARVDPILPYLTDNKEDLKKLIETLIDAGTNHIIASILDIPFKIKEEIFNKIKVIDKLLHKKYISLYKERISYMLNTKLEYRWLIFEYIKNLCNKYKITFALCMEYKLTNKKIGNKYKVEGLNKYFMTSLNCEGINVPIYKRVNDKFEEVIGCLGNCLSCKNSICGIEELKGCKALKLKDYKRWSKSI